MGLLEEVNSSKLSRPVVIEYLNTRLNCDMGEPTAGEKVYLSIAESYFENAISGLNAILNDKTRPKKNEDASWFYEALTNNKMIKEKNIPKFIKKIREAKKRLDFLVENPIESYENGNSEQLAIFVEKLRIALN
jgi:hypothetical protein